MRLRDAAALAALSFVCAPARADAAPQDAAVSPPGAEGEARAHFERGVELLRKGAWDEALLAFETSRRLYPTPAAIVDSAVCLRKLGRYDEALDRVEQLLRSFPDLPEDKRQAAEHEQAELSRLVGTMVLDGAPAAARVEVDGRARGAVPGGGLLRVAAGHHTVRLLSEGFFPFEAPVEIVAGETARVEVRLDPVPAPPPPPPPPRPPRFALELDGAAAVSPPLGVNLAQGCTGACSAGPGLGGYGVLRFGWLLAPRFDAGVAAGFLVANQGIGDRSTSIKPQGFPIQSIKADDTLKLRSGLVSAWGSVRLGERPFVLLRLGLGALLGTLGDARTAGGAVAGQRWFVGYLDVAPEARVGFQVGERVTLTAGLEAHVLFGLVRPTWDPAATPADVPGVGASTFPADRVAGDVRLVLAPGAGARYAF